MSRHWSATDKKSVLTEYIKEVYALGTNMRLAGIDKLAERAQCINKAQVKAFSDATFHRRFTGSTVKNFIVANYTVLEKLKEEFYEHRLENEQVEIPIQTPFSTSVPSIPLPAAKPAVYLGPLHDLSLYPAEVDSVEVEGTDKAHPLVARLNLILNTIQEMKTMAHQLIATSQLNVKAIDSALRTGTPTPTPRISVTTPTPTKNRVMGTARAVFSVKPKIIVCGFSRHLTDRLHDSMPRYELHVRHTDAALLQCVSEHPDANVLIMSDKYKLSEKLSYVCNAFGTTVMRIADKRETLLQVIAEVNNFSF